MKTIIKPTDPKTVSYAQFECMLKIKKPLYIKNVAFDDEKKEVHFYVDFNSGTKFSCPKCGHLECSVKATTKKVWRHLNMFEYMVYIHLRTPYIDCPNDGCGTSIYRPSWEVPSTPNGYGSKFTMLFERNILIDFIDGKPVSAISKRTGIEDKCLWRIIDRYVQQEYKNVDFTGVKRISVDETSRKKGHKYITVFTDIDTGHVLFVCEGRSGKSFWHFKREAKKHGLNPKEIKEISMDLSAAFISGAKRHYPRAAIVFDKFHVVKLLNSALNDTRKDEKTVKKCRYYLLKNSDNLKRKQRLNLNEILKLNENLALAYKLKESFIDIMDRGIKPDKAKNLINSWIKKVHKSELKHLIKFAKTVCSHFDGILN
ncbi:ISL3 family transposase ISMac21 [Clostridia bacterium]|nr:ISL3 family transposase ISMac21 [Clostridia bacterium]